MTELAVRSVIDGADEAPTPLEGLVERTKNDPGAPLKSDVLQRLWELKQEDLAAFETLRKQLRKAGCRVTVLDEALSKVGIGPRHLAIDASFSGSTVAWE